MNRSGIWAQVQLWGLLVFAIGATALAAVMFTRGTANTPILETSSGKPATLTSKTADNNPHPIAGGFKLNGRVLEECALTDRACVEQGFGNLTYREGLPDVFF